MVCADIPAGIKRRCSGPGAAVRWSNRLYRAGLWDPNSVPALPHNGEEFEKPGLITTPPHKPNHGVKNYTAGVVGTFVSLPIGLFILGSGGGNAIRIGPVHFYV